MSLKIRSLTQTANVYTFEKSGDVLEMHRHPRAQAHYMIVVRGRVHVRIPDGQAGTYDAGTVIDPGLEHEVIAVDDGSRIVNITK